MKDLIKISSMAMLLAPTVCFALEVKEDFELPVNLYLYSDYISRGVSQTKGDPAIQADATIISPSTGLYAGVWMSNLDLGGRARSEIDYYAGWSQPITDNTTIDLGYAYYSYPRQSEINFGEYYAKLSAYGFSLKAMWSNDFGGDQSTLYTVASYEKTLPYDVGLLMRYGKMDFKDEFIFSASGDAREAYDEWELKLSRSFSGFNFALSYIDTDLSDAECLSSQGFSDICGPSLVGSIGLSF